MTDQKTEQKPDHENRIREALEAGPTDGPFQVVRGGTYCWDIKTTDSYDVATTHGYVRNQVDSLPTANFIAACNPSAIRALLADMDEARAALSEAKAGGWVAVQGEPWGWAIVSNDGTTQATRARIRDFLGSHMEMPPYMQAEIAQVDREWAGLAPHRVVTLYALPAPPAQRGEG